MKKFVLSFFLFQPLIQAQAQEPTDSSTAISISPSDSAGFYYGNASDGHKTADFTVKREKIVYRRVFQVNTAGSAADVLDRAKGYARTLGANYKEDRKAHTITVPLTWKYQGASGECIEALDLSANLTIEIKDIRTRISLTDIQYVHRDKTDAQIKPVAKTDIFSRKSDCAPEKGAVELLYNCSQCRQSIQSVTSALDARFDDWAKSYQNFLKKY